MRVVTMMALGALSAVGLLPDAVQAAPAAGMGSIQGDAGRQVEQVDTRCWWQNGRRTCRSFDNRQDPNYLPSYGAASPDEYPVGSAEWYRAMDRDGRLRRDRR